MTKITGVFLFSMAIAISSFAIPIADWTYEAGVQTPAVVVSHADASIFTLSSGSTSFPSGNAPTADTAISGTGWNVANGDKWWAFTVTAEPGFSLNLDSLMFDDRASGTGPINWELTINGIDVISDQFTHSDFSSDPMNSIDLSGAPFENISTAEIRLFGYGASGSRGTWRLDNVTLDGTVEPVSSVPDSLPWGFAVLSFLAVISINEIGVFISNRRHEVAA